MRADGVMVDEWSAGWGGKYRPLATNPGYWVEIPGVLGKRSSAAGPTQLSGSMTIEELRSGVINHVLNLGIPEAAYDCTHNNIVFVWPARRTDGGSCDPNAIPEGTIFRLPANLNLDTEK